MGAPMTVEQVASSVVTRLLADPDLAQEVLTRLRQAINPTPAR